MTALLSWSAVCLFGGAAAFLTYPIVLTVRAIDDMLLLAAEEDYA